MMKKIIGSLILAATLSASAAETWVWVYFDTNTLKGWPTQFFESNIVDSVDIKWDWDADGRGTPTMQSNRIDQLAEDASPDGAADFVESYDASTGTRRKIKLNNLPGAGADVIATNELGNLYLTNAAESLSLTTSFVTVTNYDGFRGAFMTGAPAEGVLTNDSAGWYYLAFGVSFDGTAASTYTFSVTTNGTEAGIFAQRKTASTDTGDAGKLGLVYLPEAGVEIELKAKDNSSSTSITIREAQLAAVKMVHGFGLGETNTASNVGAGVGIFRQKSTFDLEFKSLNSSQFDTNATEASIKDGVPLTNAAMQFLTLQHATPDRVAVINGAGQLTNAENITVSALAWLLGLRDFVQDQLDAKLEVVKTNGVEVGSVRRTNINFLAGSGVSFLATNSVTDESIDLQITAQAGATTVQTNDVDVGTESRVDLIAGSGIEIRGTNYPGTNRIYFVVTGAGSTTVQTNSVDLGTEARLNFIAGANVTLYATNVSGTNMLAISATGAGGDSIQINGVGITDANFNLSTPAAPADSANVTWQTSGAGPASVSAYVKFDAGQFEISGGTVVISDRPFLTNLVAWKSFILTNATPSRVAVINALNQLTNSATVDLTELGYLDGVTSSLMGTNQLFPVIDGKQPADAQLDDWATVGTNEFLTVGAGESILQSSTNYTDAATNALAGVLRTRDEAVLQSSTNYTDAATNALSGVLQPQIDTKAETNAPTIWNPTVELGLLLPHLTANRALITDANKRATNSTVTSTEVSYLGGVQSSLMGTNELFPVIDGKQPADSDLTDWANIATNNLTSTNGGVVHSGTFYNPTIADYSNAGHNHEDAAGAGQLNAGSVFSAGSVPLARGGTGASLTDPGANRLWGWDDTDNDIRFWTLGSGLSYDPGTDTISATGGSATTIQTNAVDVGQEGRLNFTAGANVTITSTNVSGTNHINIAASGAGGDNITVNGSGINDADFDDATPAAPANSINVDWQTSGSGPADVSANVPFNPNQFADGGGALAIKSGVELTNQTARGVSLPALTADRAAAIDGAGNLTNAAPSVTELNYVDGVTSGLMGTNQLFPVIDGKQPADSDLDDWATVSTNEVVTTGGGETILQVSTNYTDAATNALAGVLRTRDEAVLNSSTNYTDAATNALSGVLQPQIDTKAETNGPTIWNPTIGLGLLLDPATAGRVIVTDANRRLTNAIVTETEINYLSGVDSPTGTGALVLQDSPTITTPTIGSFVNANHNHQAAAGGGQLNAGSVFNAGSVPLARGGTGSSLSDPGANRILGWDDTDNDVRFFIIGSGLSYDQGTDTLTATGGSALTVQTNAVDVGAEARLNLVAGANITITSTNVSGTNHVGISASGTGGGGLGLGDSFTNVVSYGMDNAVLALTYSGSMAIDLRTNDVQFCDLNGDVTLTTSQRAAGRNAVLMLTNKNASTATVTMQTDWNRFPTNVSSFAIPANRYAVISFQCFGTAETDVWVQWNNGAEMPYNGPLWSEFNGDQISTNNGTVSIKDGVPFTNSILRASATLPHLTADRAAVINSANQITNAASVSVTELGYLDGVTGSLAGTNTIYNVISTADQATLQSSTNYANSLTNNGTYHNPTLAGNISMPGKTALAAAYVDDSGFLTTSTTVSDTELGYLDGVTSSLMGTNQLFPVISNADEAVLQSSTNYTDAAVSTKANTNAPTLYSPTFQGSVTWTNFPVEIGAAASDETTAITQGTDKVTFVVPFAFTLTAVRASLTTAQTSGNIFTVDVNDDGTSVFSTVITIDNTETSNQSPVTPAVINAPSIADWSEITVDVDQIGDGTAKGLKVWLIGYRSL